MPAGAVCPCGELTVRLSRRCEACERRLASNRATRTSVYADPRWTRCRLLVWARDGWRCQLCGHLDVGNLQRSLDAHHRRSVLELLAFGLDPFDPDRCETRCKTCHGGTR